MSKRGDRNDWHDDWPLPSAFAQEPDRLARFEREAQVLASLNHPNIAQIYGLEAIGETAPASDSRSPGHALVMEFVEGEDLSQRLKRGPLAVAESRAIARQIADALDAAHARSIVHRDLKPANVKVRPDGTVKVLDFGLAKAMAPVEVGDPPGGAESPTTLSPAMTEAGMILGTAAYMAPEQARGRVVDKRADIWAFGCLWFEMLAGTRAFAGDDVAETMGAVIHKDPNWSALPAAVPAQIRHVLERCFEKDPKRRLRDIGDVSWDQDVTLVATTPSRRSTRLVWLSSAALALLAAVGWWRAEARREPPNQEMILTIGPTAATPSTPVTSLVGSPLISPDGSAVLFADHEGLSVRRLASLDVTHVPGSEHATNSPFWSADSSTVFYPGRDGADLMRVRMPDGAPEIMIALNGPTRSGSMSDAGTVMVSSGDLLVKRPADAAAWPATLVGVTGGEIRYPEFLPGSEDFICFLARHDDPGPGIYLATLHERSVTNLSLLVTTQTAGHYTAAGGGRLLFVKDDNLYAQTLDRATRRLEGDPALVVAGVASLPGGSVSVAEFSVASNGTVVWLPGRAALSQVTVFDRRGSQVATAGPLSLATSVEMSPDGQRVIADGDPQELLDVGQPTGLALPRASWENWSPDGARLIGFDFSGGVIERLADGASDARRIGSIPDGLGLVQDLSLDGTRVVALQGTVRYVSVTGAADARTVHELADTGEHVRSIRFSPDAHWVVYADPPAGIFVQAFPGPGRRQRIAPQGSHPVWRGDGREIAYLVRDSVWSVSVAGSGPLTFGSPERLFGGVRIPPATTATARPLTMSRDGSRVAVPQAVEEPESVGLDVLIGSAAVVGRRR